MAAPRDEDKIQANRAYNQMFDAIRENLVKKDPEKIAQAAGVIYDFDTQTMKILTMGQDVVISLPEYTAEPVLENWHHLVLLHYLDNADGTPLTGSMITISNINDGLIRGTKFERTAHEVFMRILKDKSEENIIAACKTMGAEIIEGRGDVSVRIPFLPYSPFYINFWLSDDEFDASGKMFFDASINHYLSIEDAVTVGEIVLNRLEQAL